MIKDKWLLLILLEKRLEELDDVETARELAPAEWSKFPCCWNAYGPDQGGCMRDGGPFYRDETLQGVIDKFYTFYALLRDSIEKEAESKWGWNKMYHMTFVAVEPSYEDTSHTVVLQPNRGKVVYSDICKAWHFDCGTPEELADALFAAYTVMRRRMIGGFTWRLGGQYARVKLWLWQVRRKWYWLQLWCKIRRKVLGRDPAQARS